MLFVIGAAIFFVGAGIIIYANNIIEASLQQEIIALAGTATAAIGIIIAATGYIALSVLRFFISAQSPVRFTFDSATK